MRVRVPGHRLVDRVVDDLVDEVVEARRTGRSDVHPGAFPDRFEALENGDVLGGVRHARVPLSLGATGGRTDGCGEGCPTGSERSAKPQVRALKSGVSVYQTRAPNRWCSDRFRGPRATPRAPVTRSPDRRRDGRRPLHDRGPGSATGSPRPGSSTATVSTPSRTDSGGRGRRCRADHLVPVSVEVTVRVPGREAELRPDRGERVGQPHRFVVGVARHSRRLHRAFAARRDTRLASSRRLHRAFAARRDTRLAHAHAAFIGRSLTLTPPLRPCRRRRAACGRPRCPRAPRPRS